VQLLEPATRAHYMQLFGNAWRAAVIQEWRARHAYEKERSKRLAELQAQETLSPDDEWVRAAILSERTDDAEAMRILQEFLSHNPNHPDASFSLGMLLLGFEQLEEAKRRLAPAMAANSGYRARALVELRQYYEEKGLSDELNETIRKMEELDKEAEKTNYERGTVFMHDVFLPAKMSAAETGELAKKLKPYRMIQRAWVVRKEVKYMADIPCHVLLLEVERSAFDIDRTNKELCLLRDVAGITNREYLIAYHHDTFETPRKKIMAVPGSLLFDRKTEAVTA
jgi:tetratricopeptide (TPR) repeat protein